MKYAVIFFLFFIVLQVHAQVGTVGNTTLARELYGKAKTYQAKNDLSNAILVLNQLMQMEPENIIYRRELAFTFYMAKDYKHAAQVISPVLKSNAADEETFILASKIFLANGQASNASDAINKGVKKFPNSGILYAEKGILYNNKNKHADAEAAWEEGIKNDPTFHMNYYYLTKSYFISKKFIWAAITGETFVNLESYSARTEEVKKIILDSYKQLLGSMQLKNLADDKSKKKQKENFETEIWNTYESALPDVVTGIDVDNITMLRTRFLLLWYHQSSSAYPFQLFNYLNKLIEDDMFVAYNQWLFGKASNDKDFVKWLNENVNFYTKFEDYFRKQSFKPEAGEFYKN